MVGVCGQGAGQLLAATLPTTLVWTSLWSPSIPTLETRRQSTGRTRGYHSLHYTDSVTLPTLSSSFQFEINRTDSTEEAVLLTLEPGTDIGQYLDRVFRNFDVIILETYFSFSFWLVSKDI